MKHSKPSGVTPQGNPLATVRLYTRVSGNEQKRDGYSLDAQERRGRAWCEYNNQGEPAIYAEPGVSGRKAVRPALERLMNDLRPGDTLLVKDITRFHRGGSLHTHMALERIKNAGAKIVFLDMNIDTSTPIGRMMLEQQISWAAFEVEQTMGRSLEGREEAALQGSYPVGKMPRGYQKTLNSSRRTGGITIEAHAVNSIAARRIFEIAAVSGRAEAVRQLEREGIPTPSGKGKWNNAKLTQYISTTTFKGEFTYRARSKAPLEQRINLSVPALITPELWAAANAPRRAQQKARRNPAAYPLGGHLRCAECGSGMSTLPVQNKHGRRYTYHRCNNAAGLNSYSHWQRCEHRKGHRADQLIPEIKRVLAQALRDPEIIAALNQISPQQTDSSITQQVNALEEQRSKLIDMGKRGLITLEELHDHLERTRKEAQALTRIPAIQASASAVTAQSLSDTALTVEGAELSELLEALQARFAVSADGTVALISFSIPTD